MASEREWLPQTEEKFSKEGALRAEKGSHTEFYIDIAGLTIPGETEPGLHRGEKYVLIRKMEGLEDFYFPSFYFYILCSIIIAAGYLYTPDCAPAGRAKHIFRLHRMTPCAD